jgi:hypothetical protein
MAQPSTKRSVNWWSRPSAPAPARLALRVYAALLLAAALGAVLDLRWWVTVILLLPGLGLSVRYGWTAARARGLRHSSETPIPLYIGLGACIGAISGPLSDSVPSRYWGFQVVGLAAVGDLVSRVWWWRRDRR